VGYSSRISTIETTGVALTGSVSSLASSGVGYSSRISTIEATGVALTGSVSALATSGATNATNIATNVTNIAIASGAAIALTTSGIVGGSLLASGASTTPHTFDLSNGNFFTYTLATNPQVFHLANVTKGQKFVIRAEQDSGGGNAITWFSNNTVKWAGGSAPTVTTTAGKADVFGFIAVETGLFDGFVIGQNV
jgi:hypothetical protein